MSTPDNEKWIIGEPGGPAGPFYSVVSQSGRVIAMQIPNKETARLLVLIRNATIGDFDTVHAAGRKLYDIIGRDFDKTPDNYPVDISSCDYVVRAVIEALLGKYQGS